jgi:hypothetical protein
MVADEGGYTNITITFALNNCPLVACQPPISQPPIFNIYCCLKGQMWITI